MSRADRLAERLPEREIDLLLVSDLTNVRYLTNFTGTSGLALVGANTRAFVTDFRYVEQAARQVEGFDRVQSPLATPLIDALPDLLEGQGELKVGFDDMHVSVRQHARLAELMPEDVELVAAGGVVESLRAVKEVEELERIRAAAALADDALRAVLEDGLAGRTEREVAFAIEREVRERGGEGVSFPSIVAAGPHGALPHAQPCDAEVPRNTLVIVDWGAQLDGYCSDCTRTYATGSIDDEMREVYELVLAAQQAGVGAIAPGRSGCDVDAVARDVIDAAGHGEHFGHGLGHGVGLEVHEDPRLSRAGEAELAAGNVVTVEPGVYLPGRFGVRIEDLVFITETGAEVVTSLPKELTTLD
jgi:Xaa-Pro aminopeptidase